LSEATRDLVADLQASVGPVILVSGVGLLLLSMTNRFGRVIDRARHLAVELDRVTDQRRANVLAQLAVLRRRGRVLRFAITAATTSILSVCALVLSIFAARLGHEGQALWLSAGCFAAAMLALVVSLAAFLRDITLSLNALDLELGPRACP
jgi:hypothetical protein